MGLFFEITMSNLNTTSAHWSILGTGVSALCVATALHARGESIEIIEDSEQRIAASHWAGGMLAPYCEGESAPSYITEKSLISIAWWQKYTSQVQQNGTLVVAPQRDLVELKRFATRTQQHKWIDVEQVENELNHFEQGLFFPSEGHLDPRLALAELKNNLIQSGVNIHQKKASGKIIDCRGIYARTEIESLRAVRGEMLILENPDLNIQRPIRLLHPRFSCYLVPRQNQRFMLGATMLETQNNQEITARSIMELLNAAYCIHPSFADARILETGVGLRPAYADNIPKIIYENGKFYINGMYRHGFLFAPVLAEQLIQQINGN